MEDHFSNSGLNQLPSFLGVNRTAEIIALSLATTAALEKLELGTRLHPLCNYPPLEAVADSYHGGDNIRILLLFIDFLHK